ncbi:unnamed protein product (mitochondrion) [Plasmodiophora brassicae]|uniref:Kinesin motor domain-containing protein n=2 Tax=Plasmodiophora brassicae TaxID=37360 RepID=A0A3P3YAY0_PLABS|nr:unnamed protein product [Plasmodiophora brassicae]
MFSPATPSRRHTLIRAGHGDVIAAIGAAQLHRVPVADGAPKNRKMALLEWQRARRAGAAVNNENLTPNTLITHPKPIESKPARSGPSSRSKQRLASDGKTKSARALSAAPVNIAVKDSSSEDAVGPPVKSSVSTRTSAASVAVQTDAEPGREVDASTRVNHITHSLRVWSLERQVDRLLLQRCFVDWRDLHLRAQNESRELSLHQYVVDLERQLAEAQQRARQHEDVSRSLHAQLQDALGSIRVMARFRPARPGIDTTEGLAIKPCTDSFGYDVVVHGPNKIHTFRLDHVFETADAQEAVFASVRDLIQTSCDGYNVNIFAYGATNSGKTHTLVGPDDGSSCGIISRSVEVVFSELGRLATEYNEESEIHVTYVEIYNDTLYDLFKPDSQVDLRTNPDGTTYCRNISRHQVTTPQELHERLREAQTNRTFRETQFNECSSRSHCILQLWMSSKSRSSCLSFVDLAGSECLGSSATGDASSIKETLHINRSLNSLGTCIQALATQASYVPYRDCKLTRLMSDALGGQSKTLFLITASPEAGDTVQTIASLRFATNLRSVQRGRTVRKDTSISRARSTSRM